MPPGADVVLAAAERADGANAFDRGACAEHHGVPNAVSAYILVVVVVLRHALWSVAREQACSAEDACGTFRTSGRAGAYYLFRVRVLVSAPEEECSDQYCRNANQ